MTTKRTAADLRAPWESYRTDPVREELLAPDETPDLDRIRDLLPPLTGEPVFDPRLIQANIHRLELRPHVDTGHPFLDLSVQTGLASIDATFQGDHPKYGAKLFWQRPHDSFPPVIIAAVDALSAWGLHERATRLFRYWLLRFVRVDGTIDYYGPALSEYGQLLYTAALLKARAGPAGWLRHCAAPLERMAGRLLHMHEEARRDDVALLRGSPEADERKKERAYFHNNLWVARGLLEFSRLFNRRKTTPPSLAARAREAAKRLHEDTLASIEATWPKDKTDWWLPAQAEPAERPERLTATKDASYANGRYWFEMLSSGLLPEDMANRLVEARLHGGGQFCGMSRLEHFIDDWMLADYLYGLWRLGRKRDFLLSLYGHVAFHQAEGHLTAYESITFPQGPEQGSTENSPYCLPCQLVAARAARLLVKDDG